MAKPLADRIKKADAYVARERQKSLLRHSIKVGDRVTVPWLEPNEDRNGVVVGVGTGETDDHITIKFDIKKRIVTHYRGNLNKETK